MSQVALSWVAPAGAWLITYLVHSTILIAVVWLLTRWLENRPHLGDLLWKAALVGGILTASIQTGLGIEPAAGSVGLQPAPAAVAAAELIETEIIPSPAVEPPMAEQGEPVPAEMVAAEPVRVAPVSPIENTPTAEAAPALAPRAVEADGAGAIDLSWAREPVTWLAIALAIWLGLALAFGAMAAGSWLRLRRQLAGRRDITDGPLRASLTRMLADAGNSRTIRLTGSYDIDVPIALGVLAPEICLPERALYRLSPEQRETMLAHELAHILRRDPAWRIASLAIRTLLFLQPLNRLAARRLEQTSEYLCDDWAADQTAQPLVLAKCLTEVAGWVAQPKILRTVPAMASGSGLGRRVRRLIERARAGRARARSWWLIPVIGAVLAGIVVGAPTVSAHQRAIASAMADIVPVSLEPDSSGTSDRPTAPAPKRKPARRARPVPAEPLEPAAPVAVAPSEQKVRRALAHLFPKAGFRHDADLEQTLSGLHDGDGAEQLFESLLGPNAHQVQALLAHAVGDLGDMKVDFNWHDGGKLGLHLGGDNFDVTIELPQVEVEVDIPHIGDLAEVIEAQIEAALCGLIEGCQGIDVDVEAEAEGEIEVDDDLGEEIEREAARMREEAAAVRAQAQEAMEQAQQQAHEHAQQAHQQAQQAHQQAQQAHQQAMEQARQARLEAMKEAAEAREQALEQAAEAREQALEQAAEAREHALEQAAEAREHALEQAAEAREHAAEARKHAFKDALKARKHALRAVRDATRARRHALRDVQRALRHIDKRQLAEIERALRAELGADVNLQKILDIEIDVDIDPVQVVVPPVPPTPPTPPTPPAFDDDDDDDDNDNDDDNDSSCDSN